MPSTTLLLQTTSIATAFTAAGGISGITFLDIPMLQSRPASRSLPLTRWLFSRGSHVFPTAAAISGLGFGTLAYLSRPSQSALSTFSFSGISSHTMAYAAAALLCVAIAPWTTLVMLPNNYEFIRMNSERGGARSVRAAEVLASGGEKRDRSKDDLIRGAGEGDQLADMSGPLGELPERTTEGEDEKVREMLGLFARQNLVRAVLMAAGGVVGLITALS